ncbi:MAG TPA: DUF445 domain-containing protein [Candidatus Binatia bacterium]|nr:DUF445 domain-containing protein [Candidatus Binatia bacterium]
MTTTRGASLGNISLAGAIAGLLATDMALRYGVVAGAVWQVIRQAFEAATIGGFADWFAVSALFHEVPLPVIRRHTNIIVKNRRRIVEGIADIVQNRWLAPHIIREHLALFSASQYVLHYLADEKRFDKVLGIARSLIGQVGRGLEAPEFAGFVERLVRDQLRDIQFAKPLGAWLGQYLRRGDHRRVWDFLLTAVENASQKSELQRLFQRMIGRALDEYHAAGFFKQLGIQMARRLNLVDEEQLAATFVSKMTEAVRQARSDPRHPLRSWVDGMLIEFADKLAMGDPDALAMVESVRSALIEAAGSGEILQRALRRLGATMEEGFKDADSDLNRLLRQELHRHLDRFRGNLAAQEQLDGWVKNFALELVEQRHDMIGQMVRGSLEKLSDLDLVRQIETKVGQDLQYIRLNGAIVGGFAGAVLAIIKVLT